MSAQTEPMPGGPAAKPSLFDEGIAGFLRHREVRAVLYQIVTIAVLFALVAWMGNNVVRNLQALGKDFDFGFLSLPASYDINQTPIAYDSRSSHGRAMLVGIINTGLVAVVGLFLPASSGSSSA